MSAFLSAVLLLVLATGATAYGDGGQGKEPGLEPACDELLARVDDPPAQTEAITRERIITFVLENRETLESMDAEAAARLWVCLEGGPE